MNKKFLLAGLLVLQGISLEAGKTAGELLNWANENVQEGNFSVQKTGFIERANGLGLFSDPAFPLASGARHKLTELTKEHGHCGRQGLKEERDGNVFRAFCHCLVSQCMSQYVEPPDWNVGVVTTMSEFKQSIGLVECREWTLPRLQVCFLAADFALHIFESIKFNFNREYIQGRIDQYRLAISHLMGRHCQEAFGAARVPIGQRVELFGTYRLQVGDQWLFMDLPKDASALCSDGFKVLVERGAVEFGCPHRILGLAGSTGVMGTRTVFLDRIIEGCPACTGSQGSSHNTSSLSEPSTRTSDESDESEGAEEDRKNALDFQVYGLDGIGPVCFMGSREEDPDTVTLSVKTSKLTVTGCAVKQGSRFVRMGNALMYDGTKVLSEIDASQGHCALTLSHSEGDVVDEGGELVKVYRPETLTVLSGKVEVIVHGRRMVKVGVQKGSVPFWQVSERSYERLPKGRVFRWDKNFDVNKAYVGEKEHKFQFDARRGSGWVILRDCGPSHLREIESLKVTEGEIEVSCLNGGLVMAKTFGPGMHPVDDLFKDCYCCHENLVFEVPEGCSP